MIDFNTRGRGRQRPPARIAADDAETLGWKMKIRPTRSQPIRPEWLVVVVGSMICGFDGRRVYVARLTK